MDLGKLIEDYVKTRLTIGGCVLKVLCVLFVLFGIPYAVIQIVEKFLMDLDITWPMYLMFTILVISVVVGIVVYKRSEVNPGQNVAFVLLGCSTALTVSTVMVFLYYDVLWMGVLHAVLALDSWWFTYRCFFPRKKKEDTEAKEQEN